MRKHNFDNRQVLKVSLIDLVSFEHEAIREAILHKIKDFLRNNFINGGPLGGGVWRISQKKNYSMKGGFPKCRQHRIGKV